MLNSIYPVLRFMVVVLNISILLLCASKAAAQSDGPKRSAFAVSVGPELNLPQRSLYNFGYGASLKVEVPVVSAFSISLTAGYHRFSYKNFPLIGITDLSADKFVPLKAGVRYFLDRQFYTEGELGTVIDRNKDRSTNLFTYSLGTGFIFPLTEDKRQMVDLGLRYENWSQNRLQQFAIRVAYKFGL